MEVRGQLSGVASLLPLCGTRRQISGHQTLPTESSRLLSSFGLVLLLLSDAAGLLLRHLPQPSLLQTLLWANHSVPSPFPALWSPPSTSSSGQIQAPLNHTQSCFLCIPAKSESRSPNRAVWQQREKPEFLQDASGESHIPYFCLGPYSKRRLSHRDFETLKFRSARLMCTLS